MADKKWSKSVSNIKKQITEVYANCENNINELIEKHNNGSSNPEANLSTGISLTAEIDKLVNEANDSVMGIITNAINEAQLLAVATNDKRVASFLNSLLDLQSKAISANNTKAAEKKADSTEKQIERRYMWQFYQHVVAESKKFGIDMALTSNGKKDGKDSELRDLFLGIKDIAEHAIRLRESAGKLPEYLYKVVATMDKYKEPNEERDNYDLARANTINDMLFSRDSKGKLTEKYDFTVDPGNIGTSAKLYWETIISEYKLRKEKGNENKVENARAELWEASDKRLLTACDMFVGLTDGKKGVNQEAVEEVKKLRNSLSMANAFNPQRDEIIKNINQIKECEKFSLLKDQELKDLMLSEKEMELVKDTFKQRIEDSQRNRLEASATNSEYLAIYNEQSDKTTRAMANLLNCFDNSHKSYDIVKAVERERNNTFRLVVDLFATKFANKLISRENLVKEFGGKKNLKNLFVDEKGKTLVKNDKQLTSYEFVRGFNDSELSYEGKVYKHYLGLLETKEDMIKLRDKLKNKKDLVEQDLIEISQLLGKGQGSIKNIFEAVEHLDTIPEPVKKIKADLKFFADAFGFLAVDENQVDTVTKIHNKIVERMPAEFVEKLTRERTNYNELLAEHNKENGIVDKKVEFIKNKDFGKDRGSKNMFDPALHQQEMTMGKK